VPQAGQPGTTFTSTSQVLNSRFNEDDGVVTGQQTTFTSSGNKYTQTQTVIRPDGSVTTNKQSGRVRRETPAKNEAKYDETNKPESIESKQQIPPQQPLNQQPNLHQQQQQPIPAQQQQPNLNEQNSRQQNQPHQQPQNNQQQQHQQPHNNQQQQPNYPQQQQPNYPQQQPFFPQPIPAQQFPFGIGFFGQPQFGFNQMPFGFPQFGKI
jgi:hypothetical protein